MELDFSEIKKEYTFLNRDNQPVVFKLMDDEKTCIIPTECMSYIRAGEPELTELQKKDNPHRIKVLSFVDFPGGPFLALNLDLNDWLFNKYDFLNQDHKKIITKIDIVGGKVIIEYKINPIKSHPHNAQKNTIKES